MIIRQDHIDELIHRYGLSWHFETQCLIGLNPNTEMLKYVPRADFRFAPSQWETALLCNDVSHWLGASLESSLCTMNDSRTLHHSFAYFSFRKLFISWTPLLKFLWAVCFVWLSWKPVCVNSLLMKTLQGGLCSSRLFHSSRAQP